MDELLAWETGAFGLAIFVISYLLRRVLERLFPTLRKDTPPSKAERIWEEVLLPATPVFVGVVMSLLIRNYPYPELVKTFGSRVVYGVVMGFCCGWVYRIVKAVLSKRFEVELPDPLQHSDRPPP